MTRVELSVFRSSNLSGSSNSGKVRLDSGYVSFHPIVDLPNVSGVILLKPTAIIAMPMWIGIGLKKIFQKKSNKKHST